jgi:hypothetical protein
MTDMQLTIDGREVQHPAPAGTRPPLGAAQREVMRHLGLFGHLTSTQAGVIVHDVRRAKGGRCGPQPPGDVSLACCIYAASDGTEVMKRLRKRGYVEKHFGLWFAKS